MNLTEAKDTFLDDLNRRSPNTVRAYDLAIRQLIDYAGPDFDTGDLTREIVMAAVRQVNVRNVSRNTLSSYISGISVFLRFLVLERLVSFDLIDLERLRDRMNSLLGPAPRRLPQVPSDDAVYAVIAAARAVEPTTERLELLKGRDVALLETLRSTGARVSEIVGLKRKDLNPEDRTAIVLGKGNKQRMIFFDQVTWDAIQDYLEMRDDEPANGQPVFARHDRTTGGETLPMSPTSVRNVVTKFTIEAGVDEYIHPHSFRHRVATKVLTATGDLAATQDILGHSSPTTTRVYAKLAGKRLRAAHDAAEL